MEILIKLSCDEMICAIEKMHNLIPANQKRVDNRMASKSKNKEQLFHFYGCFQWKSLLITPFCVFPNGQHKNRQPPRPRIFQKKIVSLDKEEPKENYLLRDEFIERKMIKSTFLDKMHPTTMNSDFLEYFIKQFAIH